MGDIVLEIEAPEGASDEEVKDAVVSLVGALDLLHRANGGGGLALRSVEVTTAVDE